MPTTRPRHQVTETPDVARALDLAARRWPGESRARLLVRLALMGGEAVEEQNTASADEFATRVRASEGRYGEVYADGYLDDLREDWPE